MVTGGDWKISYSIHLPTHSHPSPRRNFPFFSLDKKLSCHRWSLISHYSGVVVFSYISQSFYHSLARSHPFIKTGSCAKFICAYRTYMCVGVRFLSSIKNIPFSRKYSYCGVNFSCRYDVLVEGIKKLRRRFCACFLLAATQGKETTHTVCWWGKRNEDSRSGVGVGEGNTLKQVRFSKNVASFVFPSMSFGAT